MPPEQPVPTTTTGGEQPVASQPVAPTAPPAATPQVDPSVSALPPAPAAEEPVQLVEQTTPPAEQPAPPVVPAVPKAPQPSSEEMLAHKHIPGTPEGHETLFEEYKKLLPAIQNLPKNTEADHALRHLKKSLHWAKASVSRG